MARRSKSWTDLRADGSKKRSEKVSFMVRLRSFIRVANRVLLLLVLIGFVYGGYELYNSRVVLDFFAPKAEELRYVEYRSDGSISSEWLRSNNYFPEKKNLADIDIKRLKEEIEKITQVKKVRIDKVYPDKIRIEVEEREPMMRLAVSRGHEVKEYLMSSDGNFFEPVCIDREKVDKLKWISGIPPLIIGGKLYPYHKAGKVKELLEKGERKVPINFVRWRSINVRELGSITLPLMMVTTEDDVKIIFHSEDLDKQLERLEYILRYSADRNLGGINIIDLSLKNRADVKLRK